MCKKKGVKISNEGKHWTRRIRYRAICQLLLIPIHYCIFLYSTAYTESWKSVCSRLHHICLIYQSRSYSNPKKSASTHTPTMVRLACNYSARKNPLVRAAGLLQCVQPKWLKYSKHTTEYSLAGTSMSYERERRLDF